jgi:hypothetical protein
MNKRLLVGLATAGIIGGGVYGFAATLGVTSDTVSAGNVLVASCDTDGVQVDYTVAWDTTINAYEIDDVTVSGINAAACDTDAIAVTLLGGASPVNLTPDAVDATSEVFDASASNLAASLVNNVHVAIGG